MAKYSTGGSSGSDQGDACELCGATSDSLREANVAGADLLVCPDCAPHGDDAGSDDRGGSDGGSRDQDEPDRKKKAVQNAARANDVWEGDSSHWEQEGTDYDDDPLPYLVSEYGDVVTEARQEAGLQQAELAEELDVPESDVLAVEQGRAARADVGGSVISALEERLNVELTE